MALKTQFFGFIKENKYAVYVLFMFMLVYLINQCDTFCLIATNNSMAQEIGYGERVCDVKEENITDLEDALENANSNLTASEYCEENEVKLCAENVEPSENWCYWRYLGRGTQYQLLAGPMYVVLFAISGIPLGLASELQNLNRKVCLVACVILWSLMTTLGGFATEYWHLAITRLLLGVFSAGCVPFCTSMIADYFSASSRAAALGFFNWGIFVGYSLSFVLIIAEEELGWRAVYFIAGLPGIFIGIAVALTVKEPKRGGVEEEEKKEKALSKFSGMLSKLKTAAIHFMDPVLLLLCLGGAIRNGAGLVWAYNIVLFFGEYWPEVDVEAWMSWIPLIFGSAGAFGGGYISDKLASNKGVKGRLIILICCCMFTAPFQIGTLYLPPPWCWISHMVGYLLGEAWLGVCAAIVIELVPKDLTASGIAVYFFIIQIIGGNMNLFVTPITNSLDLRIALLITFPGLYILGGVFFILTLLLYIKREKSNYNMDGSEYKDDEDDDEDIVIKSTEPITKHKKYGSMDSLDKLDNKEKEDSL